MPRSTLIISDTHLGRPRRATADMLRPLWQGFDELIINGDVAEVQLPSLRTTSRAQVEKLQTYTKADGVELRLISGNHDAYLTDTRHITFANDQVLVMHGDALHPAVAPWTASARKLRRLTMDELAKVQDKDRNCLHTRLSIAQHVGHSEFLEEHVLHDTGGSNAIRVLQQPSEVPRVLRYWQSEPKLAMQFLDQYAPQTRFLILGHSHHAGVWKRRGRVIINTGGFTFPARPWCVVIRDNMLAVHRIRKAGGVYRRVSEPTQQFELPQTKPQNHQDKSDS